MEINFHKIALESFNKYKGRLKYDSGIWQSEMEVMYWEINFLILQNFDKKDITSFSPSITHDNTLHFFVRMGKQSFSIEVYLDDYSCLLVGNGFNHERARPFKQLPTYIKQMANKYLEQKTNEQIIIKTGN